MPKSKSTIYPPEFWAWAHLKQHCDNPNNKWHYLYGGRGITYCKGVSSFQDSLTIVGPKPQPYRNYSIDRWPNNASGGYWCGECEECIQNNWPFNMRWATRKEQANNTRTNVYIDGQALAEVAIALNAPLGTLYARRSHGKDVVAPVIRRRRSIFTKDVGSVGILRKRIKTA